MKQDTKSFGRDEILIIDHQELRRLRIRLNHFISIANLKLVVVTGHLPSTVSAFKQPTCATYCNGNTHRKSWCVKGKNNEGTFVRVHNFPVEIAHSSIMKSAVLGLAPQMVGFLESFKFRNTSFFVDNILSDFESDQGQTSTSA